MEENFGIENPLEKVEEEIKEIEEKEKKSRMEEKERSRFNNAVAITISIYAVFSAIAGLKEGQITTDTLVQMDNSVLYQAQASDEWSFYQAKSIKGDLYKIQSKMMNTETIESQKIQKDFQSEANRYDKEKQEIQDKASELEKIRDEKMKEATDLIHLHHNAGMSLVFLQIAVVLASVSSLLRKRPLWYGSMGVALLGLFYLVPLIIHGI